MALAVRLKALRVRTKKSLQEVADAVGASKAHIWDLETGRAKNPSIDLLKKLAECFQVGVADLIGENPDSGDAEPQAVAMFRQLTELSPADRDVIQSMIDRLKKSGS